MIKWIKNLVVSKRLRADSKQIREIETKVSLLKIKFNILKSTFLSNIYQEMLEEKYSAVKSQLFVLFFKKLYTKSVQIIKKLNFNKSKLT